MKSLLAFVTFFSFAAMATAPQPAPQPSQNETTPQALINMWRAPNQDLIRQMKLWQQNPRKSEVNDDQNTEARFADNTKASEDFKSPTREDAKKALNELREGPINLQRVKEILKKHSQSSELAVDNPDASS